MPAEEKKAIRDYARSLRKEISAQERTMLAASASGRLTSLPEFSKPMCVLGYVANDEELDPAPALRALKIRGCRIVYPRIGGPGALILHEIASERELEPGPFGIRQPRVASPVVARNEVEAVVVPGVAFGPGGARIGYGGGYYDRLLPDMPGAALIGYAYDEQIVGHIPVEEHDATVDVVVTPTRVLRVGSDL
ncbi:MAG: 5-formyltetrahydrofolate cyclo-ligase [Coriobacteriia bacterium]|nr:5-formyltetrahydrofolate cyclo-ligase [Coriobacteriia bacterium]